MYNKEARNTYKPLIDLSDSQLVRFLKEVTPSIYKKMFSEWRKTFVYIPTKIEEDW